MRILLFFLAVLIGLPLFSQDYSIDFGNVSHEELTMPSYEKDQDAEAVIIHDIGQAMFKKLDDRYKVVFDRKKRIKIFTQAGMDFAELRIPYYYDIKDDLLDEVKDIEAIIYNESNGSVTKTKLSEDMIFDERINQFWRVKKIAFPNVKPGSVIEFKYTRITPNVVRFPDWEFQDRIPVIYSEYTVAMIPYYEYAMLMQGAPDFDVREVYEKDTGKHFENGGAAFAINTYKDVFYKFAMKHVPAFKNEEFITSVDDYIMKLDLQLSKIHRPNGSTIRYMTTWEKMIEKMQKGDSFGRFLKKSRRIVKRNIDLSPIESLSDAGRFNWVMDYMKENFKWNGIPDKYTHQSPGQFFKTRTGNLSELNLFACAMLELADLDVYPVIFSTRGNGSINRNYPFISFFNASMILVKFDGNNILTDATEYFLPNNRIPVRNLNEIGLVIKKAKNPEDVQWVVLGSELPSEEILNMEVLIDLEMDEVTAKVDYNSTEYYALNKRKSLNNNDDDHSEAFEMGEMKIVESSVDVSAAVDRDKPLKAKYSAKGNLLSMGGKIYIDPFFGNIWKDNPLKERRRTYPVDLTHPRLHRYKTTIHVPDGYELEYTPESQNIDNDRFSLNYQVLKDANEVMVIFDYYIKKSIYQPKEYDAIKYYLGEIVKMGNEKIVLVKSEELTTGKK